MPEELNSHFPPTQVGELPGVDFWAFGLLPHPTGNGAAQAVRRICESSRQASRQTQMSAIHIVHESTNRGRWQLSPVFGSHGREPFFSDLPADTLTNPNPR